MEVLTAVHKHPISNTNVAACAGILLPICQYMHTVWTVKRSCIKIVLTVEFQAETRVAIQEIRNFAL